ncbi:polysaccharide pyruvyl transferase family protein [Oceanobacillus chungangensis]|uniref:Polysaccharide pyruvyl transferase family protein n=1 Tax=Oceanobacillus chungangensis TaxID=1229152 RepID=A0A3D8PT76_9BACI|nr:polysaccharide pyruvyl transferase family protein [Oceanobacillus chungangensis]RDW19350.1 polysaccharide pyruvyl transferase family protein [Oceanobacillus chungangensis]
MKKVLYIGWIGYKNLGDDLLWNIFYGLSEKFQLEAKQIKIVPSFPRVDISDLKPYDTIVLGGGSLISPTYIHILKKALDMNKRVIIWGSGIDRISEKNLESLQSSTKLQLRQRFNEGEAIILKNVFSRASYGGVRGNLTKQALVALGVNQEDIQVIGDPGLLLTTKKPLNKKEKIIGINWGTTLNTLYGNNEKHLELQLVETCKALINKGYKLYIYCVWDQDKAACQRLYKKIDDVENVVLDYTLYSEQELIPLLSSCTLTINYKLHPNLLSLAANVPFIALGYRYKVFDFAQSVGLEEYVLSTSNTNLLEDILNLTSKIETNTESILNTYKEKRDLYLPLIEKPFYSNLFVEVV